MTLFGTRVSFTIHRSGWLLILVLIAFSSRGVGLKFGILSGLLSALCLVIHELAHVLAAMSFHVPVQGIGIKLKGAYTLRKYARRRLHDVLIAASGPFANLVLMVAAAFVPHVGAWLVGLNLWIAVWNLLPLPGTDGYRILKTTFWPDMAIYAPKQSAIAANIAA